MIIFYEFVIGMHIPCWNPIIGDWEIWVVGKNEQWHDELKKNPNFIRGLRFGMMLSHLHLHRYHN